MSGKNGHYGRHEQGITLIELVMVLSILGILAALAAIGPGFSSAERVNSTAKELLADLQWLRYSALTQAPDDTCPDLRGMGVRFESNKRYRLFRFDDRNGNFAYDGEEEERPLAGGESDARRRNLHRSLEMKLKRGGSLIDPDNAVLLFDHYGIPRQTSFGFQQMSIVFQHPGMPEIPKRCVSISFNRIREGIWNENECREQ